MQCPYCHKHELISEAMEDTNFCLEKVGEDFRLRRDHTYYYQVNKKN